MEIEFIKHVTVWVQQLGLVGLLVAVIVGSQREWFVWGRVHRKIVTDLAEQADRREQELQARVKELLDLVAKERREAQEWRGVAIGGTSLGKSAVASLLAMLGRAETTP